MMAGIGTVAGDLWGSTSEAAWRSALDGYPETVRRQGVDGLEEMDGWVRDELPRRISGRERPHVTLDELVEVTKWKMSGGVGPATASAVAAAAAPQVYPFFDEVAAAQISELGKVAYTSAYYARYSEEIRERARKLGEGWTPVMVERALWSNAGGKVGPPAGP